MTQLDGLLLVFADRRLRPVKPLPRRWVSPNLLRQPPVCFTGDCQRAALPRSRGGHLVSRRAVIHYGSWHHAIWRTQPQDIGPTDKHWKLPETQQPVWWVFEGSETFFGVYTFTLYVIVMSWILISKHRNEQGVFFHCSLSQMRVGLSVGCWW